MSSGLVIWGLPQNLWASGSDSGNRLVDLRISDEIDADLFAQKQSELRDRIGNLKLQLDVVHRSHDEMGELAVKFLNFLKPFSCNGLLPTTPRNAASSKSSF